MNKASWRTVVMVLMLVSIGFTGCATMDASAPVTGEPLKAKPSQGAGFVPMEEMSKRPDLPFHKVWVKAGIDWKPYRSIYIKPVNTQYLMEANWWQQNFRRDDYMKDVRAVANYMQQQFIQAFRNDPNRRFQVLQAPKPGAITLELALTELVPSNVVLEAAGYAPYFIGTGVKVVEKATGAKSTVAFEARIVDSRTGAILAMAADREEAQIAPVNLKGLSWYGVANAIIDTWASQFVQIANRRPGEVIQDTSPFTLSPW